MLRVRYGRSLGSENQELALRLLCPAPTSRFSAAIQAGRHECCQQPASPCHATEGGHVGRIADRVDGPRWLKSSEQHGPDKHRRGPSTTRHRRVSRDESARRFAQDDDSVGELTERRALCGSRGAWGSLRDIALVRGVEGSRRCLSGPCCSELFNHRVRMLRARYGRSLGSENQELALRLLCPAPTSRFSAAIQAGRHGCCQQPASPCHATEGGHVGRIADRVDGPRWLKSSEQHGPDKHRRGPSTTRHKRVSRDESARRFAQDDASVGELTERRALCGSRGACGSLRSG